MKNIYICLYTVDDAGSSCLGAHVLLLVMHISHAPRAHSTNPTENGIPPRCTPAEMPLPSSLQNPHHVITRTAQQKQKHPLCTIRCLVVVSTTPTLFKILRILLLHVIPRSRAHSNPTLGMFFQLETRRGHAFVCYL